MSASRSSLRRVDEHRSDDVPGLDETADGDEPFGDEDLIPLAPAAGRRIGELDEVGQPLVAGIGDRLDHELASGSAYVP